MRTPPIHEPTSGVHPWVQAALDSWGARGPWGRPGGDPQGAPSLEVLGLAPCTRACPVGIDVKRYVGLVAEARFREAMEVIRRDNPFAAVSGFLCSRPCETECAAGDQGRPIPVRALKQLAARVVDGTGQPSTPPACPPTLGRVAVVGAGPAGLTAARDLRCLGYEVTVLEGTDALGGLLRHAVPESRLPSWAIEADLAYILAHGIGVRLGASVSGPEACQELLARGFRAVLVATGAARPAPLGLEPGHGVVHGLSLLRERRKGAPLPAFTRAVVLGAGQLGVAAATELAMGQAGSVKIVHHRDVASLPVDPEALWAADRAGVILATGLRAEVIVITGGQLRGVRCRGVTLVQGQKAGRSQMVEGAPVDLGADLVVDARTRLPELSAWPDAAVSPWGTLAVDAGALVAGHPGVFGAGEVITGARSFIEAVAQGRAAARAVHRSLSGVDEPPRAQVTGGGLRLDLEGAPSQRSPWRHLPASVGEARALPLGVDSARAGGGPGELEPLGVAEARRCRRCGPCAQCATCSPYCDELVHVDPEGRWVRSHGSTPMPNEAPLKPTRAWVDAGRCRGCGLCEESCPYSAPRVAMRARERVTSAFGRRSIPARFVSRRLNTPQYSPSSRLAGRAPRRPRCFELILSRALRRAERSLGHAFSRQHVLVASVEPRSCRGCGLCVGLCPTGAMGQGGFENREVSGRLDALLPMGREVP